MLQRVESETVRVTETELLLRFSKVYFHTNCTYIHDAMIARAMKIDVKLACAFIKLLCKLFYSWLTHY